MSEQKFGYICFIGPSNSGKSTLVNALLGEKIAITSHKPQTTRFQTKAVLTHGNCQMAIIDTPGIFEGKSTLEKAMVNAAYEAMTMVDIMYVFIDARKGFTRTIEHIMAYLSKRSIACHAIINKIDAISPEDYMAIAARCKDYDVINDVLPISALKHKNIPLLQTHMMKHIPQGKFHYNDDIISTLPEKIFAQELTREAILRFVHQEIPYNITVETEQWEMSDNLLSIHQVIHVNTQNHKAIILGKQGQKIQQIGTYMRKACEHIYEKKCFIKLFVRVSKDWQERPEFYREFML